MICIYNYSIREHAFSHESAHFLHETLLTTRPAYSKSQDSRHSPNIFGSRGHLVYFVPYLCMERTCSQIAPYTLSRFSWALCMRGSRKFCQRSSNFDNVFFFFFFFFFLCVCVCVLVLFFSVDDGIQILR